MDKPAFFRGASPQHNRNASRASSRESCRPSPNKRPAHGDDGNDEEMSGCQPSPVRPATQSEADSVHHLAISAFKLMPIPVLVLNHRKVTAVANDAAQEFFSNSPDVPDGGSVDSLQGLTLSQMRVAAYGAPTGAEPGATAEELLDFCLLESEASTSKPRRASSNAISVLITSPSHDDVPLEQLATMTARKWQPDRAQTHFILIFSDIRPYKPPATTDVNISQARRSQTRVSSSAYQSHDQHRGRAPDDESAGQTSTLTEVSIAEKVTMMTKAIITQSEVPVLAMWKDRSVVIANPGRIASSPVARCCLTYASCLSECSTRPKIWTRLV